MQEPQNQNLSSVVTAECEYINEEGTEEVFPVHDNIIVEPIDQGAMIKRHDGASQLMRIVHIGYGSYVNDNGILKSKDVIKGDKVLVMPPTVMKFNVGDKEVFLIRAQDVMAIIK